MALMPVPVHIISIPLERRCGDPERHRHSLQGQVNRSSFMDERRLELNEGFALLEPRLRALLDVLPRTGPRKGP